jgi:hypothetical protein
MLARPKWMWLKLMVQGCLFVLQNIIFGAWQTVTENEDVLSRFWSEMLCPRIAVAQGPFCPVYVYVKNFWDDKSLGRFVRVPHRER